MFPPRPSDGPRRRPTPVASVSPETDARASTTWRLQPPSACLVLWRKLRNPPSIVACTLDPGVDATASARQELWSRLPFTAIHRCLRPRSRSGRHSCRPARAPSRLPFTAVHRMVHRPRQLSVDTRRPCSCNQRPSTRSHRTVDNSLITARRRYSTFLILALFFPLVVQSC